MPKLFSNTVLTTLDNYISHEIKFATTVILFGRPLKLKNSYARKTSYIFVLKKSFLYKQLLDGLQQHLSESIENAKKKENFWNLVKLNNPNTSTKGYWFLIKTLLNGKKVPCVSSIYDNNIYVTDFKEKCQLFNSYFSKQCNLLKNNGTLLNTCSKYTKNILDTIVFSKEDIYIHIYIYI